MEIFEYTKQKSIGAKQVVKVSSILEDMVRIAVTIQIVQSQPNSIWKMQKEMCRMSRTYETLNSNFPNQIILF